MVLIFFFFFFFYYKVATFVYHFTVALLLL